MKKKGSLDMNIIVSAGGSGGHIYPALAIIKEFKKQNKNVQVLYIGTHNRMEKDIVPQKGIKYESLEIYGFTKDIIRDIKNISLIYKSYQKCIHIMEDFHPDVVIGVGGYVTYPVLKAAHKLKIKTFIHEQNSRPGKVNYLTSKFVDLVGVTFKSSMPYFKKAKQVIYTGHPALEEARNVKKMDKTTLGFKSEKKLVTIVAGSLGSDSLNQKLMAFLNSDLHSSYEILYIVGSNVNLNDFKAKIMNQKGIKVVSYIENLPGIMADSDLIISRAGAGTLFEIIGVEKPSIIIPSPNVSNNHQYYNAKELANAGVITMLEESTLTKEILAHQIKELLTNQLEVEKLIKNMKEFKKCRPTETIYQEVCKLIPPSK